MLLPTLGSTVQQEGKKKSWNEIIEFPLINFMKQQQSVTVLCPNDSGHSWLSYLIQYIF